MNTIKVTVSNSFFHGITEEFITYADVSDLEEMELAAEECCGEYLNIHGDLIPDQDWNTIAKACYYTIEEVVE